MLVDKMQRWLNWTSVPTPEPMDTSPMVLTGIMTGEMASDERVAQQAQGLLAQLEKLDESSGMAGTFWDRHVDPDTHSPEFFTEGRARFIRNYSIRRANTLTCIAKPEVLNDDWRTLVLLPSFRNEDALAQTVEWAGVRKDGLFVQGTYKPRESVIGVDTLFAHLQEDFEKPDTYAMALKAPTYHITPYGQKAALTKAVTHSFFASMANGMHDYTTEPGYSFYHETPIAGAQAVMALGSVRKKSEVNRGWKAYKALTDAMDPEILKKARSIGMGQAAGYNWLGGGSVDWHSTERYSIHNVFSLDDRNPSAASTLMPFDDERALRRQQAITLYPLLAHTVTEHALDPGTSNAERAAWDPKTANALCHAIDVGEELIPAMARCFDSNRKTIKSIQGLNWQKTGNKVATRCLHDLLETFPADHPPANKKDFAALRSSLTFVEDFGRLRHQTSLYRFYDAMGHDHGQRRAYQLTTAQAKATWAETQGRYTALAKATHNYPPGGLFDLADTLHKNLFVPIKRHLAYTEMVRDGMRPLDAIHQITHDERDDHAGTAYAALYTVMSKWTVRQAADANALWHRDILAIDTALQDPTLPSYQDHWKPVMGDITLKSGYHARELTSTVDLDRQGKLENHCVGGYSRPIKENTPSNKSNTTIYSIEKDTTRGREIVSTVQLNWALHDDPQKGVGRVSVIQNMGRSNTPVSDDVDKAGKDIAKLLSKRSFEQVKPHFDSIAGLRRTQHEAYTEVHENGTTIKLPKAWTTSGYDPRNPERIAIAVAAYAPLLPKQYRSLEALSTLMKDDPVKTATKEEFDYPF